MSTPTTYTLITFEENIDNVMVRRRGSVTGYDLDELLDMARWHEENNRVVRITNDQDELIYETGRASGPYYTMRVLGHADRLPVAQDYDLDELMGFAKRHEANGHTVVITDHCGEVYRTQELCTVGQYERVIHLFNSRDLSAETRPKYRARYFDLLSQVNRSSENNDVRWMTARQVDALIDALRSLPWINSPIAP